MCCGRPTYYGVKKGEHNPVQAALEGSTLITLPAAVHAFLLNIAYHHIHHLNMRVPGYNLKRCHDDLDPRCDPANHVPNFPFLSLASTPFSYVASSLPNMLYIPSSLLQHV